MIENIQMLVLPTKDRGDVRISKDEIAHYAIDPYQDNKLYLFTKSKINGENHFYWLKPEAMEILDKCFGIGATIAKDPRLILPVISTNPHGKSIVLKFDNKIFKG